MQTKNEKLVQLEKLQSQVALLDSKFSFLGFRFGIDAIIGLFPAVGDIVGGIISLLIVLRMRSIGVSDSALNSMIKNVLVDVVIGGIPIVGDIFDFVYKVNERNFKIALKDLS